MDPKTPSRVRVLRYVGVAALRAMRLEAGTECTPILDRTLTKIKEDYMRIVMSVLFSLAAVGSVFPASAHSSNIGVSAHTHPLACMPWSGCRK